MTHVRYKEMARMSNRELEKVFRSANAPNPHELVGYEWRGYNISTFTKLLGIQKFIKGFFASGDRVEGYNIPAVQNGLTEPWIHKPSAENPKRYAFYDVTPVDVSSKDNLYPSALLINYGSSPRNPRGGVERLLRDYLIQPDPLNPDIMLGKAYLAFGPWRLFSNFFVLERLRPTNWMLNAEH